MSSRYLVMSREMALPRNGHRYIRPSCFPRHATLWDANIRSPSLRETQVLIVGAGPTGLVLALWLARLGVRVRVIDKAEQPGTTSRAIVVHARTLEFYRQIGLADALVERGLQFAAANLWVRGSKVGRAAFGEMGKGLSPFPYLLLFPQEEHERLLIEHLTKGGVEVERQVELVGFAS